MKAGETEPTKTPEPPVSSEIAPKIPAELVRAVKGDVPLPKRIPVRVLAPLPPLETVNASPKVKAPIVAP